MEEKRKLPEAWRWARLGDYATKVGSGITPMGGQSSYLPSGIPLIRSQNVHLNRFTLEGLAYISPEQDAEMEGTRVCPEDVLLNITGASIGRVCVVPERLCPANVNQHVSIIRCKSEIHSRFLSFYISTPEFQRFIMDSQAGATRQALTKALIEDFRIPMPPLEEQKRITAILHEEMRAVERARAAVQAQLEAANALPGAYLRAVFSSSQSRQWPMRRLGDISKLLPSKSIATNGDAEVQAITTACLSEGGFLNSGIKAARMWARDLADCTIARGEVLVARSNTPELVGRVAMFPGELKGVVASDLTIRIWPAKEIKSEFLTAYLSFLYQTGYWKERAGGASGSMKKITREQIQAEQVPVPPIDEQERIAAMLNEQMASASRTRKATEEELDTINKLPAALLRRAFSGGV